MPADKKTIYTGYTIYDGVKTWYYVDDRDSLDPEIREFNVFDSITWQLRLASLMSRHEKDGDRVLISVGDFFYETPEE